MAMPSTDTDELAKFGYKQELDRSLGLVSASGMAMAHLHLAGRPRPRRRAGNPGREAGDRRPRRTRPG